MASTINSTDTGSGGLITTGDSSDELQLQTAETTALTITSGQQSAFIAGTASAPAVTTTGDLNTGIYFPAADNIGFATGGTIRGRWTTDGLCFGTDTAAANALDDYEEGTWTPTYTTSGTNFTSVTYDASITGGRYTKIGNMVYVQGGLRTDAITVGSASGSVLIGGLPFTVGSFPTRGSMSIGIVRDFSGDAPLEAAALENGTTALLFYRTSVNGSNLDLAPSDLGTGADANRLEFSGCYLI